MTLSDGHEHTEDECEKGDKYTVSMYILSLFYSVPNITGFLCDLITDNYPQITDFREIKKLQIKPEKYKNYPKTISSVFKRYIYS